MRRFICARILGHKVDISKTDSGYLYCQRCGSHDYYDNDFDVFALLQTPRYVLRFLKRKLQALKNKKEYDSLPF